MPSVKEIIYPVTTICLLLFPCLKKLNKNISISFGLYQHLNKFNKPYHNYMGPGCIWTNPVCGLNQVKR